MKKIHYAWLICAAGTILMMCNMGLCSNILTVYMPFIEEQGYTGAQGSAMISIRCISSFLCTFLVTAYYRKFSLRIGLTIATALSVVGMMVFSIGGSIWSYYLGVVILGIAYGFGTVYPTSLMITNWFHTHRGFALGITSMGSGIASVLFSPIVSTLSLNYGVRAASLVQGGFCLVCAVLVFLLVRDHPEEKGLKLYGEGEVQATKAEAEKKERFHVPGVALFLQLLMLFLLGGAGQSCSSHLSILTKTSGYSAETAAMVATIYGAFLILGKFSFGGVADRITARRASVLFGGMYMLSCAMTLMMNGTALWAAYAFAAVSGCSCAFFNVGMPLWASELSSPENFAKTLKWFQICYAGGGIIFTAVPGRIADYTGEYQSSYLMMLVMAAAAIIILLFSYRKRKTEYC